MCKRFSQHQPWNIRHFVGIHHTVNGLQLSVQIKVASIQCTWELCVCVNWWMTGLNGTLSGRSDNKSASLFFFVMSIYIPAFPVVMHCTPTIECDSRQRRNVGPQPSCLKTGDTERLWNDRPALCCTEKVSRHLWNSRVDDHTLTPTTPSALVYMKWIKGSHILFIAFTFKDRYEGDWAYNIIMTAKMYGKSLWINETMNLPYGL